MHTAYDYDYDHLRTGLARKQASPLAPRRLTLAAYAVTFSLATMALYLVISAAMVWGQTRLDDLRYGRPRTTHLSGTVGHHDSQGTPTHFVALNLQRQIVVLELPGGQADQVRSFPGPYLFGAGEELTPVGLELRDMDRDTFPDLLINVRNETIIYLNKDGTFRLPTPEEQGWIAQEQEQEQEHP